MKKVTGRTIGIERGSYGLRSVPDGYTEYRVATGYGDGTGTDVVVHVGLAVWCEVDGADRVTFREGDHPDWVTPTGLTVRGFIEAVTLAERRRAERSPA